MVDSNISIDIFADLRADLGESPIWDADRRELIWVEIDAGRVHVTDVATRVDVTYDVGGTVGAAAQCTSGDLLVARAHDAVLVSREGEVTEFVQFPGEGYWRLNDGKCDPGGRFWVGGVGLDSPEPRSSLFRVDEDGSFQAMVTEVGVSNGLGWSPDGGTMYYIDTRRRTIDAFAFDNEEGTIRDRRTVVEIPRERGSADGLTIDAEGCIWLARYRGSGVDRYTPDGTLDCELSLPVQYPTACSFGDDDLSTLYITSDAQHGEAPHAGALFACRPGVSGLPGAAFRAAPSPDATRLAAAPPRTQSLPA